MKLIGKNRMLQHPDGTLWASKWPMTREEALQEGIAKFWPLRKDCPRHPYATSLWYTVANVRACCRKDDNNILAQEMKTAGEPMNPGQAREQGKDHYWTHKTNEYCGHIGKLNIKGQCYECEQDRINSPRQLAVAAGDIWYTPVDHRPCSKGHLAPRRVANGSCKQCEEENRGSAGAPVVEKADIRAIVPADFIISRTDAVTAGFLHFRTGEPCRAGHRGWRYVSTGNCLTCMGR